MNEAASQSSLDALKMLAHVPARTWKVFAICLIGVTFANFDHSLFNFVLTQISEEFGWSEVDRGWYILITYVISGLIVTQIGVMTDRFGRKRTLLSATLITPLFVAALTFAPNTIFLLLFRSFGFATAGAQSPITVTTVLEESPPRLRGLFSGVLQVGFPIGWFIASLMVPYIVTTWGWRYIFLLSFIFLPYAWIIYRYLDEPEAWLQAQREREAAGTSHPSTMELFQPSMRRKTILLFLGQFLYVLAYGATVLLTAYFQEAKGWDVGEAIRLVGLTFGIGAFGYILAAIVGEFLISRRNTIILWCSLGGLAFAAMIWLAETYNQILLTYGMMTFFFYGSYAVIATFIAENYPPELRATATSFSGSFAVNLGFGVGPLIASLVLSVAGWQWAFTWSAIVPVFVAGGVFLALKPVPRV